MELLFLGLVFDPELLALLLDHTLLHNDHIWLFVLHLLLDFLLENIDLVILLECFGFGFFDRLQLGVPSYEDQSELISTD